MTLTKVFPSVTNSDNAVLTYGEIAVLLPTKAILELQLFIFSLEAAVNSDIERAKEHREHVMQRVRSKLRELEAAEAAAKKEQVYNTAVSLISGRWFAGAPELTYWPDRDTIEQKYKITSEWKNGSTELSVSLQHKTNGHTASLTHFVDLRSIPSVAKMHEELASLDNCLKHAETTLTAATRKQEKLPLLVQAEIIKTLEKQGVVFVQPIAQRVKAAYDSLQPQPPQADATS